MKCWQVDFEDGYHLVAAADPEEAIAVVVQTMGEEVMEGGPPVVTERLDLETPIKDEDTDTVQTLRKFFDAAQGPEYLAASGVW